MHVQQGRRLSQRRKLTLSHHRTDHQESRSEISGNHGQIIKETQHSARPSPEEELPTTRPQVA